MLLYGNKSARVSMNNPDHSENEGIDFAALTLTVYCTTSINISVAEEI